MRRIIEFFKKIFTKKVITINTTVIEIVPWRREINYTKLLPSIETAQTIYDYMYNKYVSSLTQYDREKAEVYKDLMLDIKSLSEKQWHTIKF